MVPAGRVLSSGLLRARSHARSLVLMKSCCVFATWRGSYILAFVTYNGDPRRAKE